MRAAPRMAVPTSPERPCRVTPMMDRAQKAARISSVLFLSLLYNTKPVTARRCAEQDCQWKDNDYRREAKKHLHS